MEIHEIRYFLAVCETLNFTRASELCNVSQPALTRAIHSLEANLGGGPLIHRERANTHLTELGRLMQPYLRSMLDSMEEALKTARSYASSASGVLRLGLMCTIGPQRMVGLFEGLHHSHPGIKLQLKDNDANSLQEQLARGELDAAVYCRPEALDDRFHTLPLYQERFMIAFPREHEWATRDEVAFRDLHGRPYLSRISCEYNDHIDAIMAQLGVEPVYSYESERDDWIQSMVMAGLGCTSIPEFALTIPDLPRLLLVQPEITRTVHLVTVRGRPHGTAVGALIHAIKDHGWTSEVRRPHRIRASDRV